MSESESKNRINKLRKLLATVVNNTKATMSGGKGHAKREEAATKALLNELLGREPNSGEIELASTY